VIQLVTDSASMLPDEVRRRFGIDVVALTITIDGEDFAEGVDLTTADFYDRMAAGAEVSTQRRRSSTPASDRYPLRSPSGRQLRCSTGVARLQRLQPPPNARRATPEASSSSASRRWHGAAGGSSPSAEVGAHTGPGTLGVVYTPI
jgi:fatty acid-binding protein DegV